MNCKKPYLYPKQSTRFKVLSDEEIEKIADELYPTVPIGGMYQHTYNYDEKQGLIKGMKMYREQLKQIQNGRR